MSITDELRAWVRDGKGSLLAIADRIDAEHESACAEAYGNGVMSVPIAMDENAWVKLPKDADGEYIRIGDEVETTNFGTVEVEGFVHRAVAFYNYSEQPAYLCTTPANLCRHHHAPTVEDVLREFALAVCKDEALTVRKGVVEEFAAKLRLAEENASTNDSQT